MTQPFEHVYRDLIMRRFWWEARLGLQIAFYRTYAVPSVARVLLDTGEIVNRPIKRGYDTGIIMYELIYHGFEHPRGRRMVDTLIRMHRRFSIRDDEYRFVLGALTFIPPRTIDRFGARRLSNLDREASFRFYHHLGSLMRIPGIPDTAEEFEAEFDSYERATFAFSPAAATLINASRSLAVQRMPRALRGIAGALHDTVLDEPMRRALGVRRPPAHVRLPLLGALHARRAIKRLLPANGKQVWEPGRPNPAYPGGYTLDDIGPAPVSQ